MASTTLFEILGIPPLTPDSEIQKVVLIAYQRWVVKMERKGLPVPDDVTVAYKVLRDDGERTTYRRLHTAWKRKSPLLVWLDEQQVLSEFADKTFFRIWECPAGILDDKGESPPLDKGLIFITLKDEAPPWGHVGPPLKWVKPAAIALSVLLLCTVGWCVYYYVYRAPERLAAAIRDEDAKLSDVLSEVQQKESKFASDVGSVVGVIPSDGAMPNDLARVCFREREAARAWDEIRARKTDASSLASFQTTKLAIEDRIKIGSFRDADKTSLIDAVATVKDRDASYPELRRDLDLLRVLLEAERLPSAESTHPKGAT